jgi:CRISPR-associated endonuclease Csn1
VDGFPLYITGKTGNQFAVRNACNLVLAPYWEQYIHAIDKSNLSGRIADEISAEDNVRLYDELQNKHQRGIYAKRPNPIGDVLEKGREKFVGLNIERQVYILSQILNLSLICNSSLADLKEIGGSAKTGVTFINKKISGHKEFKLINYSITGMYEREVDLLKI